MGEYIFLKRSIRLNTLDSTRMLHYGLRLSVHTYESNKTKHRRLMKQTALPGPHLLLKTEYRHAIVSFHIFCRYAALSVVLYPSAYRGERQDRK